MQAEIFRYYFREWMHAPHFAKRRRLAALMAAGLVVAGVFFSVSLFFYAKWKARQVRVLTTLAEGYHSQSRPMEARMGWETALRLNPNDPRALVGLARWHEAAGESFEALHSWQRAAESGGMSPGEAADYLQTALRQGEGEISLRLANSLVAGGDRAIPHLVRSELHHSKGEFESAEKELRLAVERDSTPRSGMLLARRLLRSGRAGPAEREALDLLRSFSQRDDQAGLDALRELLGSGRIAPEETALLLRQLRSHSQADGTCHLLADFHELRIRPENREAILQAASDRLAKSSAQDRAAALPWMLQVAGPAFAMPLLTLGEAASDHSVFPLWLQAHALGARWDVVLQACESPGVPLPVHMRHLYRGRALSKLGRAAESRAAYDEAQSPEARTPEAVADIPAYFLLAGEEALFAEAFQDALKSGAPVEPLFQKIVTTTRQFGDARRLREIYRMAEKHSPLAGNPSLQNDAAHLDLLLGETIDREFTGRRLEENPKDFAMRTTHALALLQSGKPGDALTVLSSGETETRLSTLPPSHQAVVAAVLAAAGKIKEAQGIAAALSPAALLVQERELLALHLAGGKVETPSRADVGRKGIGEFRFCD
jgi:tetratricopeptide (TPR) repeat protein